MKKGAKIGIIVGVVLAVVAAVVIALVIITGTPHKITFPKSTDLPAGVEILNTEQTEKLEGEREYPNSSTVAFRLKLPKTYDPTAVKLKYNGAEITDRSMAPVVSDATSNYIEFRFVTNGNGTVALVESSLIDAYKITNLSENYVQYTTYLSGLAANDMVAYNGGFTFNIATVVDPEPPMSGFSQQLNLTSLTLNVNDQNITFDNDGYYMAPDQSYVLYRGDYYGGQDLLTYTFMNVKKELRIKAYGDPTASSFMVKSPYTTQSMLYFSGLEEPVAYDSPITVTLNMHEQMFLDLKEKAEGYMGPGGTYDAINLGLKVNEVIVPFPFLEKADGVYELTDNWTTTLNMYNCYVGTFTIGARVGSADYIDSALETPKQAWKFEASAEIYNAQTLEDQNSFVLSFAATTNTYLAIPAFGLDIITEGTVAFATGGSYNNSTAAYGFQYGLGYTEILNYMDGDNEVHVISENGAMRVNLTINPTYDVLDEGTLVVGDEEYSLNNAAFKEWFQNPMQQGAYTGAGFSGLTIAKAFTSNLGLPQTLIPNTIQISIADPTDFYENGYVLFDIIGTFAPVTVSVSFKVNGNEDEAFYIESGEFVPVYTKQFSAEHNTEVVFGTLPRAGFGQTAFVSLEDQYFVLINGEFVSRSTSFISIDGGHIQTNAAGENIEYIRYMFSIGNMFTNDIPEDLEIELIKIDSPLELKITNIPSSIAAQDITENGGSSYYMYEEYPVLSVGDSIPVSIQTGLYAIGFDLGETLGSDGSDGVDEFNARFTITFNGKTITAGDGIRLIHPEGDTATEYQKVATIQVSELFSYEDYLAGDYDNGIEISITEK
ncbi:MAG: hypothetical protein LBM01_01195 [Christensenellaceae bacterium]|jgi:hypothetical protein|nr:hypothetical protein [Christensenellaceae bacterium]